VYSETDNGGLASETSRRKDDLWLVRFASLDARVLGFSCADVYFKSLSFARIERLRKHTSNETEYRLRPHETTLSISIVKSTVKLTVYVVDDSKFRKQPIVHKSDDVMCLEWFTSH
jgi:hypothetical protein